MKQLYYLTIRIQSNCKNINARKNRNKSRERLMKLYLRMYGRIVKNHKANRFARGIAGYEMDNEPQGQAGKRVLDSFSLKIALYDCSRSRLRRLSRAFTSAYKQR